MKRLLRQIDFKTLMRMGIIVFAYLIFQYGVLPAFNNTRGDFANYYTASRLLADGVPFERAYSDFVWFQQQMDRYGIENQVGGFIPHPPSTALVFLPLAPFNPVTAKNIWTSLGIVLVILNIWLLTRIAGGGWLVTTLLFLGTGYGLINNFLFGQQYLLVTSTILLGIFFYQRGQFAAAGVCFALMTPVKYFGVVFIAYGLWQKKWPLVLSASLTIAAVLGATVVLAGSQVFSTFASEVLTRHLVGEIQDPFSVYFQSWNSLFGRLFLAEPTLNATPPMPSVFLFYLCKNAIFWSLLAFTLYIFSKLHYNDRARTNLLHFALLPVVVLLIAPANTTYYFLLMAMSAVFLVKLLQDSNRPAAAAVIGALFVVLNLPHFMKLQFLASSWTTPLAYSRLWLTLTFFVITIWIFREKIRPLVPKSAGFWATLALVVATTTALGYTKRMGRVTDAAQWLRVDSPVFNRHLGLLMKSPSVSGGKLVFSYCELLNDNYAIYTGEGDRLTPRGIPNYYHPSLAADGQKLLAETIFDGTNWITASDRPYQKPGLLIPGSSPAWHPGGENFACVQAGRILIVSPDDFDAEEFDMPGEVYDLAYSADGQRLAFCSKTESGYTLGIFNTAGRGTETILFSDQRIDEPCWAEDDGAILFSWRQNGNRDVWVANVADKSLARLTLDPAADSSPTWDARNRWVIFTSDRGRGLEFSTLYWLPFPGDNPGGTTSTTTNKSAQ